MRASPGWSIINPLITQALNGEWVLWSAPQTQTAPLPLAVRMSPCLGKSPWSHSKTAGKSSEVPIIQGSKNKREDEESTAVTTQRPGTKSQDLGGAMLLDLGLSHRGSKYGDAKGRRHTAKRGCGPWERQNQCLWGELILFHRFAQWKVILLPWQEGSSSHIVQCSSTVPIGAPWPLDCRGPHSPTRVQGSAVQGPKPSAVLSGP